MDMRGQDIVSIISAVNPAVIDGTEAFTEIDSAKTFIDMSKFEQAVFIALSGDLSNHGPLKIICYEATAADGTGATELAIGSLTDNAAHVDDNDNLQWKSSVRAEQLSDGFQFLGFGIKTAASQTGSMAGVLLGINPRHGLADDASSVDESVPA